MFKKLAYQIFPTLLLAGNAFAQGEKTPTSGYMSFMPIVLLFVIFYFLLIRPQQKKSKDHKEMLSKLQKGDLVVTSGGILGKITGVAENCYTVEINDNVKIKVAKDYIVAKKH